MGIKTGLKILLIDDNKDTVKALKILLERRGFIAHPAFDSRSALEVARTARVGVAVCDIGLPDGRGLQLLETLRREYGIIGIVLSGYGTEDDIQKSMDVGAMAHLVKPSSFIQILEAINQAMEIVENKKMLL